MHPRAEELIRLLDMRQHPEGGWFREVHRSALEVRPKGRSSSRTALTHIYYLLNSGDVSHWHRVMADEVWSFYEGEPLELLTIAPDTVRVQRALLGPLGGPTTPAHVVPAGWWQAAKPAGAYSLLGCSVGPGFEFLDFTMLAHDSEEMIRFRAAGMDLEGLV